MTIAFRVRQKPFRARTKAPALPPRVPGLGWAVEGRHKELKGLTSLCILNDVHSEEAARRAYQIQRPDYVITDVRPPYEGGVDTLRETQ